MWEGGCGERVLYASHDDVAMKTDNKGAIHTV